MSKAEAVEYVSACLKGEIKPDDIPKPVVPEDIADSLIIRRYMLEGREMNTIKTGRSASAISRIRSGEIKKPRKNRIIQIGVALGLTPEQLRQFVRSSGHSFPISKAML